MGSPAAIDALLARLRRPDRPAPAGHGPPQRLAIRARLAHGSARAPGRGSDRAGGPRARAVSPGLAHATFFLETPGMDEGYDAINMRACPGPRRRPAAGAAAARGVSAARQRQGAHGPGVTDRLESASPSPCSSAVAAVAAPGRICRRAGTWEADQGHDMLILRALVQDGIVPLLGPPTSIGDVHHGALVLLPPEPGRRCHRW